MQRPLDVLVACEYSGIVRDAFIQQGHNALSCDVLPSESGYGRHHQGDIRDVLHHKWDLIVAHPPCTRLANSGVRWLHERNLWSELDDATAFFRMFLEHPCPHVAVENPIMHKHAVERVGRKHDQVVQPWQHGHGETKAIALWLKRLPPLEPTDPVEGREQRVWRMAPGPERAKERSRFFRGVAQAMAKQWGAYAQRY